MLKIPKGNKPNRANQSCEENAELIKRSYKNLTSPIHLCIDRLLTHKVSDESAVEIRDALHASGHVTGPRDLPCCLLLVVIVAQDEAQQQPRHHDVSDSQHGEVASCGAAWRQRAGMKVKL